MQTKTVLPTFPIVEAKPWRMSWHSNKVGQLMDLNSKVCTCTVVLFVRLRFDMRNK